jgi:hypothetical protein
MPKHDFGNSVPQLSGNRSPQSLVPPFSGAGTHDLIRHSLNTYNAETGMVLRFPAAAENNEVIVTAENLSSPFPVTFDGNGSIVVAPGIGKVGLTVEFEGPGLFVTWQFAGTTWLPIQTYYSIPDVLLDKVVYNEDGEALRGEDGSVMVFE